MLAADDVLIVGDVLIEGDAMIEDDVESDGPIDTDILEVACADADRNTDTDADGFTEADTLVLASKDSDGDLELVQLLVPVSEEEVDALGSAKSMFRIGRSELSSRVAKLTRLAHAPSSEVELTGITAIANPRTLVPHSAESITPCTMLAKLGVA